LLRFARPYRRAFALVAVFALLATATDLLAPVVYRYAVNDIAGLFVGPPGNTAMDRLLARRAAAAQRGEPATRAAPPTPRAGMHLESHQRGHIAPRTMHQALRTLIWSVSLLFAINVFTRFCALVAALPVVPATATSAFRRYRGAYCSSRSKCGASSAANWNDLTSR